MMGFDLWTAMGVSAQTGLAVAAGGLVVAALMALRIVMRNRGASAQAARFSLRDGD